MPSRIIDEFPMLGQVEKATAHEIVAWYFYLRPTMSNDELPIVKAIAGRYERMDSGTRDALRARVQREYSQ